MPYFQRRPYAEMLHEARGMPHDPIEGGFAENVATMADAILRDEMGPGGLTKTGDPSVPVFRVRKSVAGGDKGTMVVGFHNDDQENPTEISATASDLVGPEGTRIPEHCIEITPSRFSVPAGGSCDVQIEIAVPTIGASGRYAGMLNADADNGLQAMIEMNVT